MDLARLLRHLATTSTRVRRAFPAPALRSIEQAIAASEASHAGEIRFVVEGALDGLPLLRGQTARERAIELFARLHVWDTEHNTGVLIYVLIWVAMLPAGLGVLVLVPVLAGTLYASFQDVFGDVPALPPAAPETAE